jgi:putative IMPACT (imprinted ancient) family translation regulator
MSSDSVRRAVEFNTEYRTIAEDCLRKAQAVQNDDEKPFWLNLAQSWLQLAQHSRRPAADVETGEPPAR